MPQRKLLEQAARTRPSVSTASIKACAACSADSSALIRPEPAAAADAGAMAVVRH